jgi:hypothetical protein
MRDDPRKDATFNGTIPEMYDRFSALLFEPFAVDLAGRVGSLKIGPTLKHPQNRSRQLSASQPELVARPSEFGDLRDGPTEFSAR